MKFFISSTAYDLYDFRAKIKQIIQDEGQEFIAFEGADFPIRPNLHSHDQCIEAVKDSDFVICILDKRYGSKYAGNDKNQFKDIHLTINGYTKAGKRKKFDKKITNEQMSITWCELITAQNNNKEIFTFVRKKLFDEKEVRRKNQFFKSFKPAYAEKEELYDLIDWITKSRINNWITTFDSIVDFEIYFRKWLKEICKNRYIPKSSTNAELSKEVYLSRNNTATKDVILFVVEGETDRAFISLVLQKLNINIEAKFIVTYGKYRMFNNLMEYVVDTGDIKAFFILYDTDSDDASKIEENNSALKKLSKHCPIEIFPIEPEIEAWIRAGLQEDSNISNIKVFRKICLDIEFDINRAQKNNGSFKKFIETIRFYENSSSNH